jgi:two-component system sensor histidine kinase PilS (NtrC family)
MSLAAAQDPWEALSTLEPASDPERRSDLDRLWRGLMTARATLGLTLVVLQVGLYLINPPHSLWALGLCGFYAASAAAVRLFARPGLLREHLDPRWAMTVGLDVVVFGALHVLQNSAINYAPLLALPALMAAVLGSLRLSMGVAAGITLLLFGHAFYLAWHTPWDTSGYFLQAALTGAGGFAVAFVTSQLATRMAHSEARAQRHMAAAELQRQVNALVIQTLSEGVLVADAIGQVRSVNPAADLLLGRSGQAVTTADLQTQPAYAELLGLIRRSFASQQAQQADLLIQHPQQGARRLRAHTQLTPAFTEAGTGLCVVFLQDQREIQARIRSEKLAGMGRMSAAVAHEIRNPLAAIAQANALLAEDLTDPGLQRLTQMIAQNTQRLEKMTQDILQLTHTGTRADSPTIDVADMLPRICQDWLLQQSQGVPPVLTRAGSGPLDVGFEADHLRRVIFNLLDNARRYGTPGPQSVQMDLAEPAQGQVLLRVWSQGAPLEPTVERHLFEPFFSSESRSSGLGLYICRSLCESHGATLGFERSTRRVLGEPAFGNEFNIAFIHRPPLPAASP